MRRSIIMIVGMLIVAAPAAAQPAAERATAAARWHPQWGDWSLSFQLPAGGATGFGVWRQAGPNTALGFTLDGSLMFGHDVDGTGGEQRDLALSAGPTVKRYWWSDGPVSPFFHGRMAGTYAVAGATGEVTRWRYGGLLGIGIGAEWFPVRGVGVSGHTGVAATYTIFDDDAGPAQSLRAVRVDLLTSALTLQLYF